MTLITTEVLQYPSHMRTHNKHSLHLLMLAKLSLLICKLRLGASSNILDLDLRSCCVLPLQEHPAAILE